MWPPYWSRKIKVIRTYNSHSDGKQPPPYTACRPSKAHFRRPPSIPSIYSLNIMRWFILSMLILCVSASSNGGRDAEVSVNRSLADVEPLMIPGERNLRVCAFNVKIFGRTYMRRKREAVDILIQVKHPMIDIMYLKQSSQNVCCMFLCKSQYVLIAR